MSSKREHSYYAITYTSWSQIRSDWLRYSDKARTITLDWHNKCDLRLTHSLPHNATAHVHVVVDRGE